MKANITLTISDGAHRGAEYRLENRETFVIGRDYDCDLRLPNYAEFRTVSRRHCLLGVTTTSIWLRDLGSRNGTYLNGKQIDTAEFWSFSDDQLLRSCADYELKDGDEFVLGSVAFRARIHAPLEEVTEE